MNLIHLLAQHSAKVLMARKEHPASVTRHACHQARPCAAINGWRSGATTKTLTVGAVTTTKGQEHASGLRSANTGSKKKRPEMKLSLD